MVDTEKSYKKAFHERSVLDSFRLYLDLSDSFLEEISKAKLVTADELLIVKKLAWPSNRNEFLQYLIRKKWNEKSFVKFCDILKTTQSNDLSEMLQKSAGEILKKENHIYETETLVLDSYLQGIDAQLGGTKMSLEARNAVRGLLKEKDKEIREAQTENIELRMALKQMSQENYMQHQQITTLDTAVNDTLAVLHFETSPDTPGQGMAMVKDRLERQMKEIFSQRDENKQLRDQITKLKQSISDLTKENIDLKQENTEISTRFDTLSEETTKKIRSLTVEVAGLKKNLADSREKLLYTQSKLKDTSNRLQEQIKDITAKLSATSKELKLTAKDRDAAKKELTEVSDRIRKLMTKLGMSNDIDKLGLSIDHARNLSYLNRRHGNDPHAQPLSLGSSPKLPEVVTPDSGSGNAVKKMKTDSSDYFENGIIDGAPQNTPRTSINEHICIVCNRSYDQVNNFVGACVHHEHGAVKIHEGTELEVWSCCKAKATLKGCIKSKHTQVVE